MSHELEIVDGIAAMVWTKEKPWHGLGIEMDPKAGAHEWMKSAQLDWDVIKIPTTVTLPNGATLDVLGAKGTPYSTLVRDHGNSKFAQEDVFGPVGPEWEPVQNSEVFDFLHRFTKSGKMTMETCGSLKGGTEIWALIKFADNFEIAKGDEMTGYLLFHSCHVWGKGNVIKLTPVRVVCNNTLAMSLRDGNTSFRMPHTRAFDDEVQKSAIQALGLANDQMDTFKAVAEVLSTTRAKDEDVQEFIASIYQPKKLAELRAENDNLQMAPASDIFTPTSENVWEAIHLAPGADLKSSKGTWWGAFNGVTYMEDHLKISFKDPGNVLQSAWFGGGAKRKEQALDMALVYAQAS